MTPVENLMQDSSIAELSTTEKANAAFEKVAIRVLERARQSQTPVVVWADGEVKHLTADQAEQIAPKSTTNDSNITNHNRRQLTKD